MPALSRSAAPLTAAAILEARAVSVGFGGNPDAPTFNVLKEMNLEVPAGKFVALLGPSGSGKTTFLRAVAGMVPVSSGLIHINGKPATEGHSDIGMVFQSPRLLPWRTTLRNITYSLELRRRGLPRAQMEEIARQFINLVGLTGFERYYPGQLSGGMQQRVNLARALAVEPVLMLMDEPFASLDAQTREVMQFELLRIWQQSQQTIIFVTHDIAEAIFMADTIVVFSSRPARVIEHIEVPFSRPRPREIKFTPEFSRIAEHIWHLLEAHREGAE